MNTKKATLNDIKTLPILPLRDVVIFPFVVSPLFVGRPKSITAVKKANDGLIVLIGQKEISTEHPKKKDLFEVGTVGKILQQITLSDGSLKLLVEGIARAKLIAFHESGEFWYGEIKTIQEVNKKMSNAGIGLAKKIAKLFEKYIELNNKIPKEVANAIQSEIPTNIQRMVDTIASHVQTEISDKQEILAAFDLTVRMEKLEFILKQAIEILEIEKNINTRIKSQMEKSQREYYLNEQIKAIQNELGQSEGGTVNEHDELTKRINKAKMPKSVMEKAKAELNKLKLMSPMSAEATVVRGYIDWLLNVPWKNKSRLTLDIAKAEAILEENHYGLPKVKEHILEYLAVQHRVKKVKGPILCLVGPPGVGKTSLGKSIADATGRDFVRFSLGGVRDEAEIRGHRRTYIGSMPGKIIQNMAKVGKKNPLFLLDEVDKMSMDFRGDPASALLEVLDPEQNQNFNDHYLEVDYDLSEVMFVTTANSLNIPSPLLDRMEVLRISGYTEEEKVEIAKRYLIPRQREMNGIKEKEIAIGDATIVNIIRHYTKEAGVRTLERCIARICRKTLKKILQKKQAPILPIKVTPANLEKLIGVARYRVDNKAEENRVGQVTGLAWTEAGGELLSIEVAIVPGKGNTNFTGRLGDVMKESIEAALTFVRSRSKSLGLDDDFYSKNDFHVHVPEGAIPKDGPSAGIAMCTALVSAMTGIPVLSSVTMTGEITLRGEVLPIGGLKEKLLAALRGGIETVLIPKQNENELKEIPKNIIADLKIIPVQWADIALEHALERSTASLLKKKKKTASSVISSRTAKKDVGSPSERRQPN